LRVDGVDFAFREEGIVSGSSTDWDVGTHVGMVSLKELHQN